MAEGVGSQYFSGAMDNTEVSFGIMHALGIGAKISRDNFIWFLRERFLFAALYKLKRRIIE